MRTIICLAIALLAFLHLTATEPERIYHDNIKHLRDSVACLISTDTLPPITALSIECRGSMPSIGSRSKSNENYWGIMWNLTPEGDCLSATIAPADDAFGHTVSDPCLMLSLKRTIDGTTGEVASEKIRKGINAFRGENTLAVEIKENGTTTILLGHNELNEVMTLNLEPPRGRAAVVSVGETNIALAVSEYEPDRRYDLQTQWTSDRIEHYLKSNKTEHIEGYWNYLDRETDETKGRLGGRYRLALIKVDDGYDLIYVSGAETGSSQWECGMRKGRLRPTIFTSHYDLEWTDAKFNTMHTDIHADIEQGAILTLSFPLLKSKIRFALEIPDK